MTWWAVEEKKAPSFLAESTLKGRLAAGIGYSGLDPGQRQYTGMHDPRGSQLTTIPNPSIYPRFCW